MKKKIERKYEIDGQDVREAILVWLRSKGQPVPQYIGNTPICQYTHADNGAVTIEWTENDSVET